MEMRISLGDNSFALGPGGQVMSVADSLKSECGTDFDEYVRRALEEPFPYNSMSPASRNIQNLWNGRRLKIYSNKTKFREGKVVSWTQWNTGPFSRITEWQVEIEMDSFDAGDTVVVEGLQAAKQHNGKEGRIIKYLESEGRYKVKLVEEKTYIAIKPQNLKPTPTSFSVNRMNIEGGGTLIPGGSGRGLVSLEWMEPASPVIDLDEGAIKANCPTCRAVEPPLAAYDDSPPEKQHECPICLETTTCRVLQCQHAVCNGCWDKWRSAASGIPVRPPEIDTEELQRERAENDKFALTLLPQEVGGMGLKADDSEETRKELDERIEAFLSNKLESLVDDANSGEQGLVRFWKEMRVLSMRWLTATIFHNRLFQELPTLALEILMQVLEERKDVFVSTIQNSMRPRRSYAQSAAQFQFMCCACCNRIGEKYEEVHNYRGAIPFYERSMAHGMQALGNGSYGENSLAPMYCNLGLAQKYAGLLSAALENYEASIQVAANPGVVENRKTLLREMKQWTGNSGKLTPGC